ncbi:efflux RND transporter periplasmic adaptor subunit [Desulforhopalus vacuolatus]|uniref:efflux RND transporter periplasmic adaptor subunit n=1 Tax=Desulforhopalus vacuolatus TaxID=40414 RepID=UPI0019630780|nr:efflux RND transporter periplasmic adaptor subunit [Desulforhopalus vacuolatus]MBM9520250.1 efflux RND transporter periplasmic adaptor subunit [Desulforhopalus vacuolatus]
MLLKQKNPNPVNLEISETKMKKRPQRSLASLVLRRLLPLAVIMAGAGTAFWLMETGPQAKPKARVRNTTLVEYTSVNYGPRQTMITGMGTVAAARTVELKPQVTGSITELSAELIPGGHFQQGETLLKIDPADYRLTVKQLTTDVAKAESDLQLEQGNQLIAQKEYTLLNETVSDVEKALILRRPQRENLRATLESARIRLEQARVDLARTEIKAPFNAVVLSRAVDIGTRADESTVLATLVGTDACWVTVSIPVDQLRWIKIPQKQADQGALVRVYDSAAWGDGVFREGRVIRLEAGLEEQGRMARLLVQVEDPLSLKPDSAEQPQMLIGEYVRVEIQGQGMTSAAAIDRAFIRNGNSVWIMDGDGNLVIRPVEIAFKGTDQLLITSGIAAGEKLITTDIAAPVAGMSLKAVDNTASRMATKETAGQGDRS